MKSERHNGSANENRPGRADLLASLHKTVPDVIAPGLKVLFCGINPGLYSAWSGHHFAKPGNRFWPALFAAGFTERLLQPSEDRQLLSCGYGITNLVERASVGAAELSEQELLDGGKALRRKLRRYKPQFVAVLGVSAYRLAFNRKHVQIGPVEESMEGAAIWVLPNPSGLNAHFTPKTLAKLFREFRSAVER